MRARVGVVEVFFPVASEHRVSSDGSDVPEKIWATSAALLERERSRGGRFGGCRVRAGFGNALILH